MTWDFVHRWYMPFIWITLSSLVTVPLAIHHQLGMELQTGTELGLAYGDSWVVRDEFLESLVFYGANLFAAIWLFNADGSTRWAAFWATLLGLARIVVPIMLATMSDVGFAANTHYVDWQTLRVVIWFQDAQFFLFGLMLWATFGRFVGESSALMSHSGHYAEA